MNDANPCTAVPADADARARLREAVDVYVRRERLVPPLLRGELEAHAAVLMTALRVPASQHAFIALLLANAVWHDTVAAVPYDRRLLLLPQCLSRHGVCRAERDEVGLICAACGACDIAGLQREAVALGYVTLVAEGATVVRMLLSGGKVDAVIGVGCLASLERIFPDMSSHAIPGLAVPLLSDGCRDTAVDVAWLRELLRLHRASGPAPLPDLDVLRERVAGWFSPEALHALLGRPRAQVERLAMEWLAAGGKRWRPLLTAAVHDVLSEADEAGAEDAARAAAVAVECFHKASLIHDDIEDGDETRYGRPTLHATHGTPIAINVGDYLLGEGYRLLAVSPVEASRRLRMLATAASGHRALCLGQGEELAFTAEPRPLTVSAYERLCGRKTGAAFEVALCLGAIRAGADAATCETLARFSLALGVAYQIRDDLADAGVPGGGGDLHARRPSILLALACECGQPDVQVALDAFWAGEAGCAHGEAMERLWRAIGRAGLRERAEQLCEHHLHAAERALAELRHAGLKRLLRRVAARLLASGETVSLSRVAETGP